MRNPDPPPLVSVIIPCFRQAHFLDDCIGSVLAQHDVRLEIIVVDDGSPDNVPSVVKQYERVLCIRQENAGLAAARNTGLRSSRGDYVLFLDADDRLTPGAITSALERLEARPECAFAYGHVRLIDIDGKQLPTPHQRGVHADHYRALLSGNYIWTAGTALYRRSVLDELGGFDVSLPAAEDYEMHFRITRCWPVCCTERVVLEYRVHSTSMSHRPALMLRETVRVHRSEKPYVRGQPDLEAAWRQGLRVLQFDYGEKLISHMIEQAHKGEWRGTFQNAGVLLRYHGFGLAKLLKRETFALFQRAG